MNKTRVGLALVLASLMAGCGTKTNKPDESVAAQEVAVNELPKVTLIEETGNSFSATGLPGKTILIFFGAECDHCQREAADIQKNLKGFENYTIYFVSVDSFEQMKKFATTYHLDHQPNVKFVRADGSTVYSAFGNITTPTICVYSENKRLSKRFDGETSAATILEVL